MTGAGVVEVLAASAFLGWRYFRARAGNSSVPAGDIVFQDTGRIEMIEPLVSHSLRLTGKPDYLIRTMEGLIPIEVKSRICGLRGAYEGEVAQVAAYCMLVEDVFGEPAPFGLLQFTDREAKVPFTDGRRAKLLALMAEMWELEGVEDVVRSHESLARCRGCGVRAQCGDVAPELLMGASERSDRNEPGQCHPRRSR